MIDLPDRIRGSLLGLAVGDALGMPVEGLDEAEIECRFGRVTEMMAAEEGHFHFGLKAGQYTDDTEETIILAKSMIEAQGFSCDHFSQRLADWGSSWASGLDRGVGLATRSSVEALIAGCSWRETGSPIPTCGSAMRVAPIGLVYHCNLDIVARYADLQSLPTHTSTSSRAGAVAVAAGVALSLQGWKPLATIEKASALAGRVDVEMGARLRMTVDLLEEDEEVARRVLGSSPAAVETVPAAFYYFLKFPPEEAVTCAASGGGDSDSIAAIAGALAGAASGSGWIPERWLSVLEGREMISAVGEALTRLSESLCR
ncbi:MAG: ADP-ribosylglycohydrolase family protein [Methanotrichaceae archaeon]|nr:ADP-ribosylglycohydrolase family protein [Methanotrichaceae archaeon]